MERRGWIRTLVCLIAALVMLCLHCTAKTIPQRNGHRQEFVRKLEDDLREERLETMEPILTQPSGDGEVAETIMPLKEIEDFSDHSIEPKVVASASDVSSSSGINPRDVSSSFGTTQTETPISEESFSRSSLQSTEKEEAFSGSTILRETNGISEFTIPTGTNGISEFTTPTETNGISEFTIPAGTNGISEVRTTSSRSHTSDIESDTSKSPGQGTGFTFPMSDGSTKEIYSSQPTNSNTKKDRELEDTETPRHQEEVFDAKRIERNVHDTNNDQVTQDSTSFGKSQTQNGTIFSENKLTTISSFISDEDRDAYESTSDTDIHTTVLKSTVPDIDRYDSVQTDVYERSESVPGSLTETIHFTSRSLNVGVSGDQNQDEKSSSRSLSTERVSRKPYSHSRAGTLVTKSSGDDGVSNSGASLAFAPENDSEDNGNQQSTLDELHKSSPMPLTPPDATFTSSKTSRKKAHYHSDTPTNLQTETSSGSNNSPTSVMVTDVPHGNTVIRSGNTPTQPRNKRKADVTGDNDKGLTTTPQSSVHPAETTTDDDNNGISNANDPIQTTTDVGVPPTTTPPLKGYDETCSNSDECKGSLICKNNKCACAENKWYVKSQDKCKKAEDWGLKYEADVERNDTPNGIKVSWTISNKESLDSYVIVYKESSQQPQEKSVSKESTSSIITGLDVGRTYTVWMELVLSSSQERIPTEDKKNVTIVPWKPRDLRLVRRGKSWIKLAWDAPQDGQVESYEIKLSNSKETKNETKASDETEVTIGNLKTTATYSAEVRVVVNNERSVPSVLSGLQTLKEPQAPTNLKFDNKIPNATLKWTSSDSDIDLVNYEVNVTCSLSGDHDLETNTTCVEVNFVQNGDCCVFEVTGRNEIGKGEKATLKKDPELPDGGPHPDVRDITKSNDGIVFDVSWPPSTVGSIYQFIVNATNQKTMKSVSKVLYCKDSEDEKCVIPCGFQEQGPGKNSFSPSQRKIPVEFDMKPGVTYVIEVIPRTVSRDLDIVQSSIKTPDSAPTSSVRKVKITDLTHDAVNVEWKRPSEPNGDIIYYNVSLEYNLEICNKPAGSKRKDEIEYRKITAKGGAWSKTYRISNLRSYTKYTMKITAVNGGGQSDIWTSPKKFQTKKNTTTGPVRNVNISTKANGISFTWEPPCPHNGPVEYFLYVSAKSGTVIRQFTTNSTSFRILKLSPATDYSLRFNSTSEVNMIVSDWPFRTRDGIPGPVEDLIVSQEMDKSKRRALLCEWSPPKETNGHITNYTIIYKNDKNHKIIHTASAFSTRDEQWVVPETSYNITVAANTGGGQGAIKYRTIYIDAGIPEAPKERPESPLVHQGKVCSKTLNFDDTKSVMLNLPTSDFLCNSNHEQRFGHITQRGVLASLVQNDNDMVPDPTIDPLCDGCHKIYFPCGYSECKTTSSGVSNYLIGAETCTKTGCNKFLNPGSTYRFKAYVCTSAGCVSTLSSLPIKTKAEKTSTTDSMIVGVIIAILMILIIIIVVIVALKNKDRIKKLLRRQPPDPNVMPLQVRLKKPVELTKLVEHVEKMHKDSNLLFSQEYEMVTELSPDLSTEYAANPQCRLKNRYTNVLPFDHTRVKLLSSDDDESSDYINASFIPGYSGPREYIAAQGPLPSTIDDFWRMVWEHQVNAIVMLTQVTEKGKVKCEQYWPSDSSNAAFYGDLQVRLRSESVLSDYIIRVIDLEMGNTKKTVHQFHFLKFPDFGCPDETHLLLNLVDAVRSHTPHSPESPIVVHCSAGVGRTGTYIALDVMMRYLKDEKCKEVDIFNFTLKMRYSRPLMVQRENQYIYIFDCLRDTILNVSDRERSEAEEEDGPLYANCVAETPT